MQHSLRIRSLLVLPIALGLVVASGCATRGKARVIETESGRIGVLGEGKDQADARIAAIDGATSYCDKQDQKPIFPDKELDGSRKKSALNLNLKNLPFVGKVFDSPDKSQVEMVFRCG